MRPAKKQPPEADDLGSPGKLGATADGLFRLAFHNSPAMQSVVRASDGLLVEVNDTFLKKLGFQREQVIGKTPLELNFWIEPQELAAYREEFQSKGRVVGREVRLRASNGNTFTVLLSSHPVEIGGVLHVLSAGVDITSRKQAEAELQLAHEKLGQSEERFGKAFRSSPAMMAITRLSDGRFVTVNEAFLRAIGYGEDEVIGRTGKELRLHTTPEQREIFLQGIAEHGFVRDHELVIRSKDGRLITLLASGERTEIDGTPHLLSVALDITARKDAEARLLESERRLRESEARFSTAFHASPLIMSVAKPSDTRLLEVNEAFVRFVGLPREEIVGRTSEELGLWVRSEERERFYKLLGRGRLVRNFEALMQVHNGDLRNLQVSAELLEINGETHQLTFAVDVTDQRRAERVLQDAETRTRALYESISAAAMVHDEKGFLQVNSAAVKLFGAKRMEDIVGLHPGQVSPPTQPDGESSFAKAQRHMARAMAEGTHRFEWVCRKLDGTDFPVEVTLTTLELEGRRVMQAVVLDLTERKRAEVELQNALEKERELSQLKSDFVSLVSHEFRTPLEIIMSSADNLQRYHDRLATEKREQLLSTIHKSVRRMAGMMEEVLVLGRLETDRMTFKPAAVELRSFCQRVCDEIESATGRRCPIHLQANGTPDQAIGDESMLRHIFTNLLSNAVKYSPPGHGVDFVIERTGDDAFCQIVDRGCGIPEADQKRLFQAFHRGSNVRQTPGTGLGLLIVQRCVDLHGGKIEFQSVEGKGTTFTVTLPLFVGADVRRL
ncbi:MAG: PAS domain S-box protein [Verrucomicrobiales bacterium]|nr:PAS domain S-box protein [Verrucomicrobiales bacterium]